MDRIDVSTRALRCVGIEMWMVEGRHWGLLGGWSEKRIQVLHGEGEGGGDGRRGMEDEGPSGRGKWYGILWCVVDWACDYTTEASRDNMQVSLCGV